MNKSILAIAGIVIIIVVAVSLQWKEKSEIANIGYSMLVNTRQGAADMRIKTDLAGIREVLTITKVDTPLLDGTMVVQDDGSYEAMGGLKILSDNAAKYGATLAHPSPNPVGQRSYYLDMEGSEYLLTAELLNNSWYYITKAGLTGEMVNKPICSSSSCPQ